MSIYYTLVELRNKVVKYVLKREKMPDEWYNRDDVLVERLIGYVMMMMTQLPPATDSTGNKTVAGKSGKF